MCFCLDLILHMSNQEQVILFMTNIECSGSEKILSVNAACVHDTYTLSFMLSVLRDFICMHTCDIFI